MCARFRHHLRRLNIHRWLPNQRPWEPCLVRDFFASVQPIHSSDNKALATASSMARCDASCLPSSRQPVPSKSVNVSRPIHPLSHPCTHLPFVILRRPETLPWLGALDNHSPVRASQARAAPRHPPHHVNLQHLSQCYLSDDNWISWTRENHKRHDKPNIIP